MFEKFGNMSTLEMTSQDASVAQAPAQYSTASTRLLLDLLRLSRSGDRSATSDPNADALDGVITKPVLRSLLAALRLRDPNTVQHVRRTALFATGLARFLGWEGTALRKLEIAALLHDIGKIGVPDHVLFKPGPLNPAELELFALQHYVGVDVLQACRVDQEVLSIINQSNPNYDNGSRTNTERSLGSRILAISDAYDSMSHKQVFRDAKSHDEILSIMSGSAGTRFDGNLVGVMNRWVQAEGVPFGREMDEPASMVSSGFFQLAEEMQASSMCHIFSYLYVLESMYDGFYLVDSELRFRIWNTGMERLLGRPASQTLDKSWTSQQIEFSDTRGHVISELARPLREVIKSGRPQTAQLKMRHANGSWFDVEVMSVPMIDHDGSLQGVAEIFRDLSQDRRRRREDKDLKKQATTDSLTGVANRGELERTMESLLSEFNRRPNAEPFSVIFLDVDHFKSVNDTYLHLTGDQVLVGLAKLLQDETYSGELVSRYGGEEFVLVCPTTELQQAVAKAERLRSSIAGARFTKVDNLKITVSFGVTEVEQGDTMEDIFRRADKALFISKEKGRNRTTSLSKHELINGKAETQTPGGKPTYTLDGSFLACVTSDMIVLKFGSFIKEQQAQIITTEEGHAVLRVGGTLLLPFWGASQKRQPVEMDITFGPPPRIAGQPIKMGASERTFFQVKMTPRGWPPDIQTFQQRARQLLRALKSHFVAD